MNFENCRRCGVAITEENKVTFDLRPATVCKNCYEKDQARYKARKAQKDLSKRWAVRQMSEVEKAWLACAIDGEGCITLSRRKNNSYVKIIQIANCDYGFLTRAQEIIGCGAVYLQGEKFLRENQRTTFIYRLTASKAIFEVLAQIEPYFIIKKKQSQNMRAFIQMASMKKRLRSRDDTVALNEMVKVQKTLNRRGADRS